MLTTTATLDEMEAGRTPLVAGMAALGDLRPGSLTLTYINCGKPNCYRPQGGDHRHGP